MDDLQNTEGFGWMAVSLGCATLTITPTNCLFLRLQRRT